VCDIGHEEVFSSEEGEEECKWGEDGDGWGYDLSEGEDDGGVEDHVEGDESEDA